MPTSRSRRKPPSSSRPRAVQPPVVKQPAPGLRGKVERASAPALLWLSARPRVVVPGLSATLLLAGLATPPALGVPLLLLLVLLVGWLSYLSWPVVVGVQRFLRLGTIGLVLAAVAGKLGG